MKITFTTNPKSFEKVNSLIEFSIAAIEADPRVQKGLNISQNDLKQMRTFRKQLFKGFINSIKNDSKKDK